MKKRTVVLVYPRLGADSRNMNLHPPIPLLYLASMLKDHDVQIFDQRVDRIERFDELLGRDPICVGFSIMTGVQIQFALDLAEKVCQRGIPTVFGGVHATILPEQTAADPRVDYVVAGDGELLFGQLLEALAAGKKPNRILDGESMGQIDLDAIPALPYDLVDVENYTHSAVLKGRSLPFLFSRGCPYRCTFCCNPVISRGRWRRMSVDAAMNQLDAMVSKYDLDGIFFLDENITSNAKVMNEIAGKIGGRFQWYAQARADSLLKYDLSFMKEMGAYCFGSGLESGSPRILEQIRKNETVEQYIEANQRLAEAGVGIWYNYITGYPGETVDELKMTVDLALRMLDENPYACNNTFYLLTPYPGTEIGDSMKENMPDTLEGWADFGRHNYNAQWHPPENMKRYQRIGFSSKFVGRRLAQRFDNPDLRTLGEEMTQKWRDFDFDRDDEWEVFTERGWKILKSIFGEDAY
ncbi:MAG: B12-binding domain-containing radical SAM protein [Phycisphaerae bacterium]|nr:B12-binding domain-containing radical SAM protein [Phycisphaerae bacterium]